MPWSMVSSPACVAAEVVSEIVPPCCDRNKELPYSSGQSAAFGSSKVSRLSKSLKIKVQSRNARIQEDLAG